MRLSAAVGAALLGVGLGSPAAATGDDPLGWHLEQPANGRWELFYGEPGTDNIGMVMTCRRGEGAVHLSGVGLDGELDDNQPPNRPFTTEVGLVSGRHEQGFSGRAIYHEETGAMLEDARIAVSNPLLMNFRSTGLLSVDHNPISADSERERGLIRTFFRHCSRR